MFVDKYFDNLLDLIDIDQSILKLFNRFFEDENSREED